MQIMTTGTTAQATIILLYFTGEEVSLSFPTPFLLAFFISLVLRMSLLAAANVPGYKNAVHNAAVNM